MSVLGIFLVGDLLKYACCDIVSIVIALSYSDKEGLPH
jgi:hypothetical protein